MRDTPPEPPYKEIRTNPIVETGQRKRLQPKLFPNLCLSRIIRSPVPGPDTLHKEIAP